MLVTIAPDNNTGFRKHIEQLSLVPNIKSKCILVKTKGDEILNEIISLNPKLTIIGGKKWIIRNKHILGQIPGKKGILFCSPLAQAEISNEEITQLNLYLKWLSEKKIDYLFVSSPNLVNVFNLENIIYLPPPLFSNDLNIKLNLKKKKNIVGILNDKASHKNSINSIIGTVQSEKLDKLIVNRLKDEHIDFIKFLPNKNKIEILGFLERKKFNEQINKCKVLLHLSFSESFCYAAFEALIKGIPVLITNAMPWFNHPYLFVENPINIKEVKQSIEKIFNLSEEEYLKLCNESYLIAKTAILKNNEIVKNTLTNLSS